LVVDPHYYKFPYGTNRVNNATLTRYPAALRRGGLFSGDETTVSENRTVAESQLRTTINKAYEILSGNIPENAALPTR
jgi:hypothetical protein